MSCLLFDEAQISKSNSQIGRSGEMANRLFKTYKNSGMPHGCHIYAISSDMAMDTMRVYPPSQHLLPHYKFLLRCCENCPHIDIPVQESDRHHSDTSPSISFNIYHLIARCTVHGRLQIDKHTFLFMFTISVYCVTCKTIHQKIACCD